MYKNIILNVTLNCYYTSKHVNLKIVNNTYIKGNSPFDSSYQSASASIYSVLYIV